MSHVVNEENDFEDLPENLSAEMVEQIKSARKRASEIIECLEPRHINSYAGLVRILDQQLYATKLQAGMVIPVADRLASLRRGVEEMERVVNEKRPPFWRRVLGLT